MCCHSFVSFLISLDRPVGPVDRLLDPSPLPQASLPVPDGLRADAGEGSGDDVTAALPDAPREACRHGGACHPPLTATVTEAFMVSRSVTLSAWASYFLCLFGNHAPSLTLLPYSSFKVLH